METTSASLVLLGASHQTVPLAVRERLSLDDARAAALADRLHAHAAVNEFTLLSTCNRTELYAVVQTPETATLLRRMLTESLDGDPALAEVFVLRQGPEAIHHLFSVAIGLDSQIVGEAEILGQVKDAYDRALQQQWTGPVLNRVFQKTFQAAKHLRTETAIGEGQINIATVAVELAGQIFGDLAEASVLVVGAGDIGLKTVQAFRSRGASRITVASRTLSKAEEAAASAGGWAASLAELPELLAKADVVACSTSAPGAIITKADVAATRRRRAGRPLFLLDLALPRDVEPACAELSDVYLYNLDDLARVADANLARRKAEVTRCRQIITERAQHLWPQVEHSLRANPSPQS